MLLYNILYYGRYATDQSKSLIFDPGVHINMIFNCRNRIEKFHYNRFLDVSTEAVTLHAALSDIYTMAKRLNCF